MPWDCAGMYNQQCDIQVCLNMVDDGRIIYGQLVMGNSRFTDRFGVAMVCGLFGLVHNCRIWPKFPAASHPKKVEK